MDLIRKTGVEEKRPLKSCGVVLREMKAATIAQRNISIDFKNEELLDPIAYQRNSWMTAEEELRKKHIDSAASSCVKRKKPNEGRSFEKILREVRNNAKSEDSGIDVKSVRQTRISHILVELESETEEKVSKLISTDEGNNWFPKYRYLQE